MHTEYYVDQPPTFERRGTVATVTFRSGDQTFTFVMQPYVFKKGCVDGAAVADDLFATLNVERIRGSG